MDDRAISFKSLKFFLDGRAIELRTGETPAGMAGKSGSFMAVNEACSAARLLASFNLRCSWAMILRYSSILATKRSYISLTCANCSIFVTWQGSQNSASL